MRIVQKKYFAGILAAALALAGCSTTSTGAANAKGIHAVATTTQICDYLTQIANNGMKLVKTDSAGHETTSGDGDVTLNLTCLLAPNASAHEHEMTPQQMKALAQADLLFVNGVDLEHFLDSAVKSSGFKGTMSVTSGVSEEKGDGYTVELGDQKVDVRRKARIHPRPPRVDRRETGRRPGV